MVPKLKTSINTFVVFGFVSVFLTQHTVIHLACIHSEFCMCFVSVITQVGCSMGCWVIILDLDKLSLREISICLLGSFWFNWGQSHVVVWRLSELFATNSLLSSRQGTQGNDEMSDAQQKTVQVGNCDKS